MPFCHCISHGCGENPHGVEADKRTIDKHGIADYRLKASESREDQLQKTEDAIGSFVSSMSLADKMSGPLTQSGGRLWSLAPAAPSDVSVMDAHITEHPPQLRSTNQPKPRSKKERLTEFLGRLKGIEQRVGELISTSSSSLASLGSPQHVDELFPLESDLQHARALHSELSHIKSGFDEVVATKQFISDRLDRLVRMLKTGKKMWIEAARLVRPSEHSAPTPGSPAEYSCEHHYRPILIGVNPVIQAIVFTMVALQIVSKVARSGCHFVLEMMGYVLWLALTGAQAHISPQTAKLLNDLPVDPDSAVRQFELNGKNTIYAVCPNPNCHHTYKPDYKEGCPIAQYPPRCMHRRFPQGPPCGTALTRPRIIKDVEILTPIKPFVSFDFKDWLARLISRPGYECRMDGAWAKAKVSPENGMTDVFHGDFLRTFVGPDNKKLYMDGDGEGRYAFTLCVDFFNPLSNKQAGKKGSIGIISLACLNLPPDERYKPENMFLAGIIPGPKEPPLNLLNYYLSPLVDDLLEFWESGVRFSRTYDHPTGREVHCALIAVICDLPAARKIAGFASFHHQHFCSICHCTRFQQGYGSTEYESWHRRTNSECRQSSDAFATAPDQSSQNAVFEASGIRYSELSRLPYFDLAKCVVVDAMHNLFLGLVKEHFHNIIGIGRAKTAEGTVVPIQFTEPPGDFTDAEQKSLKALKTMLEQPLNDKIVSSLEAVKKKLMRMHHRALALACDQLELDEEKEYLNDEGKAMYSKSTCSEDLVAWRSDQVEYRDEGANTSTRLGQVLTEEELQQIWFDLSEISTPTWVTPVPLNLGSSSHGKLKADQWRTLGITHLPLSLIRLWGLCNSDDPRSQKCKEILDATISLISAVVLASSRTTSSSIANAYLTHMKAYMEGIKKIFPQYRFRPNHHMALHLHEYLHRFGPVHSWWTFPFERLIGMLERIPTNFKIGQLEQTISESFTRAANLRAFVSKTNQCPPAILGCQTIFQCLVDPRARNSLTTDVMGFISVKQTEVIIWNTLATSKVPSHLQPILRRYASNLRVERAQFLTHLMIRGLRYTPSTKNLRNSCVLLLASISSDPVPAVIDSIFKVQTSAENVETLLAVRHYKALPTSYLPKFHTIGASIWSSELGDIEIVKPESIDSHYASLAFQTTHLDDKTSAVQVIAVISLARVAPPVSPDNDLDMLDSILSIGDSSL